MPLYQYYAVDASGLPATGQIEAESLAQAVTLLDARGLTIQSIQVPQREHAAGGDNPFAGDNPAGRALVERAILDRHLALVLERGRELVPALRAYSQELPAGRRRVQLEEVIAILDRGDAAQASRALAALPGYWIPLLSAATASRDPGRILREFLAESERAAQLQRQWWLTLAYPGLLLALAAVVFLAISLFVVPIFRDILVGFGLRLPWLTRFILAAAEWIATGKIVVSIAVVVGIALLMWWLTKLLPERLRHWFGDVLGVRLGRSTALARLAQFTADLLEAELMPPQALRLAGMATGNPPLRRAAWRAASSLEAGRRATWGTSSILTSTILHALASDLPASARVQLLREISLIYAERAQLRLSWTRGIIEPLAICFIGFAVGVIVLAMFLPLIALVNGLAG
jgi:type IV pilus assembly protein PilC